MRNRRIILLVQLQLRKTLEVAEMPLYSSHIFFFGCVSFFSPPFSYFFLLYIYIFFSPLQRLLFCPLLYFVFLFILFFFCCLSVLLLSLFDKRCSPKRTVTLDEAVVEMEDEEEEKKQKMNAQVSLWEIRRNAVEWRLLTALAIHKQWQTLEIAAIFRSTCINVYRSFFGPSLFQSIDYFYWVPAKASSA